MGMILWAAVLLVLAALCGGEGVGVSHLLTTATKLHARNRGPLEVGHQLNAIVRQFLVSNGVTVREYVFQTKPKDVRSTADPIPEDERPLNVADYLIDALDCSLSVWSHIVTQRADHKGKLIALFKGSPDVRTVIAYGLFDITMDGPSRCAKLEALCSSGKEIGVRGAGAAATLSFIASMLTGDIVHELPVKVDPPHLCIETLPTTYELRDKYYPNFGFVSPEGSSVADAMQANMQQLESSALRAARQFLLRDSGSKRSDKREEKGKLGTHSDAHDEDFELGIKPEDEHDMHMRIVTDDESDSESDHDSVVVSGEKKRTTRKPMKRESKRVKNAKDVPRRRKPKKTCIVC